MTQQPDVPMLLEECRRQGLKTTGHLTSVLFALAEGPEHPDAEELRDLVQSTGRRIPLASVYRVVAHLTKVGIVVTRHFMSGKARYELASRQVHDHLIDLQSGQVVEFHDATMDELEERIAAQLGYRIVSRRVELYAVPVSADTGKNGKA